MFAVFMFYPLFYTLYLSFFEWNMVKPVKKFVGLGNYISVLKDPNTWKIFGNTFWYIVILLVFNFVMPYILSFRFCGHYSMPITVESFIGTSSRKISCC